MKRLHILYSSLVAWILLIVSGGTAMAQDFNPDSPPEPGMLSVYMEADLYGAATFAQTHSNGIYVPGEKATVVVFPNNDYDFVEWQENGVSVATTKDYTFIVNKTTRLVAKMLFNPKENPREPGSSEYRVIATATPSDGGSLSQSGDGSYEKGSEVTVTANPYPDYQFSHWEENGETVSEEATYTFAISRHRTLEAVFIWYPSNPNEPGHDGGVLYLTNNNVNAGTLQQSGAGVYQIGTKVTLKASAFSGYRFVGWYNESGVRLSAATTYQIEIKQKTTKIEGRFERQSSGGGSGGGTSNETTKPDIEISVDTGTGGDETEAQGTVEIKGNPQVGEWIEVTAVPNDGYAFEGWYLDGEFIEDAEMIYLMQVGEDMSKLTVKFAELPFTLEVEGASEEFGQVVRLRNSVAELEAKEVKGYTFEGWYLEERLLSKELKYNFNVSTLRALLPVITARYKSSTVANETIQKQTFRIANGYVYSDKIIVVVKGYDWNGRLLENKSVSTTQLSLTELQGTIIVLRFADGSVETIKKIK